MADDKYRLLPDWENKLRERHEAEAERQRTDPFYIRINAWADALKEEARLAGIEIEEAAKRAWHEDVRLAVAAVLEEEAKLADDVKLRLARARAAKAAKADRKAKEADVERLVPHIKLASAASGRKLAISDKCVRQIRPHLPKEEQGATFEMTKAAIRAALDRG